jgi:hypothetical protein
MDTSLFVDDLELVIGLLMKAQSEYSEKIGDDSLVLHDTIVETIGTLQGKLNTDKAIDIFGTDGNGRAVYYLEEE